MAASNREDGSLQWLRWALVTPYLWLLLFFLAPFFIILKISLADPVVALPPFTPLLDWAATGWARIHVTLDNYLFLFEDPYYVTIYLSSLKMSAISTVLCLLLGYPMAYFIAARTTPQPAVACGHFAILDFVPVARVRLDRFAQHQWRD
jgi:putrescine transport system permease protein